MFMRPFKRKEKMEEKEIKKYLNSGNKANISSNFSETDPNHCYILYVCPCTYNSTCHRTGMETRAQFSDYAGTRHARDDFGWHEVCNTYTWHTFYEEAVFAVVHLVVSLRIISSSRVYLLHQFSVFSQTILPVFSLDEKHNQKLHFILGTLLKEKRKIN